MFRYLAISWNSTDPAASQSAGNLARHVAQGPEWTESFNQPGLRIFCSASAADPARSIPLKHNRGVVVGTLFEPARADGEAARQLERFEESESDIIVKSHGRHLVSAYWGAYVAFLRDPQGGSRWILKSPMGSLPCFRFRSMGMDIFFSRMEDCLALGVDCSVNWNYLTAYVVSRGLSCRETAIDNVFEVKGGECCVLQDTRVYTELYWNPATVAATLAIEDPQAAVRLVHDTTSSCTLSLASAYRTILHQLSGGLDSSIVAGFLKRSAATVVCANQYNEGSNCDERYFARLAADTAELPLLELHRNPNISLRDACSANRTALIYDFCTRLEHAQTIQPIVQARKIAAIFTGNGGDEIFHRACQVPTATDFIHQHGVHAKLMSIIVSDALLQQVSVWKIMRKMFDFRAADAHSLAKRQFHQLRTSIQKNGLINQDLLATLEGSPLAPHPWLAELNATAPGKLLQILLLCGRSYDNPFAKPDSPTIVDPLLSQPVVEACLRIPTYVHMRGGVSRAVAREAFVGIVPEEIRRRTTKGGIEGHIKELMTRNAAFVRDVLFNGTLVRERLVNRHKLEEALAVSPTRSNLYAADITGLFSTELWLQLWAQPRQRAAA